MTELNQSTVIAIVVGTALYHNGQHYDVGDEIELTPAEYAELAIYLQPKDEALRLAEEAQALADEQAQQLAEQAEREAQETQEALLRAQDAQLQAEALAAENGLRAEQAEARVEELTRLLADKEAEVASLTAQLTAFQSEKNKTSKGKKTDAPADNGGTEEG